jgi:hypothetical protein
MNHSHLLAQYITNEVLKKAKITSRLTNNRRSNFINNNFDLVVTNSGFDTFKNPILKKAAKHISKCNTLGEVAEFISEKTSPVAADEVTRIVNLLTAKMDQGYETLTMVEADVADMMAHYNTLYKQNTAMISTDITAEYAINQEDWNGIDCMGPENRIIAEVNAPTDDDDPSLLFLSRFVDRIGLELEENDRVYDTFKPSPELMTAVKANLENQPIEETVFEGLFLSMCKKNGLNYYLSSIRDLRMVALHEHSLASSKSTIQMLNKFMRVFDKVCMDEKKTSYVDNKLVHRNLGILRKIVQAHVYLMCNFRYGFWKGLLVLPNGKFNSDELNNAYAKGLTKQDLRALRYCMDKAGVQNKSMTVDDVVSKKDYCNTVVNNDTEAIQVKQIMDHTKAVNYGMTRAISGYFQKYGKTSNVADDKAMAIVMECSTLNRPPEYGFFLVSAEQHGGGPLVMQMAEEIGGVMNAISTESDGEVTKREKDEAVLIASTKLLTRFICASL